AFAPYRVECGIAPDEDQPRRRVTWWAFLGPCLECTQARFLVGFLRPVEIAEIAQQRADCLGPRADKCFLDPGNVAHDAPVISLSITPLWKIRIGRISNVQLSPSLMRLAASIASSRLSLSTM